MGFREEDAASHGISWIYSGISLYAPCLGSKRNRVIGNVEILTIYLPRSEAGDDRLSLRHFMSWRCP